MTNQRTRPQYLKKKNNVVLNADQVGARVRDAIELAIDTAKKSPCHYRHGGVLFSNNRIYGLGYNENRYVNWVRYSRKIGEWGFTMHAEMACMHNIKHKRIKNSIIAVVRINKSGQLRNSEPCDTCLYEMKRKGISKCYYSIGEELIGLIDIKNYA